MKKNQTLKKEYTDKEIKEAEKKILDEYNLKTEQEEHINGLLAKRGRKQFLKDAVIIYRAAYNQEYIDHLMYVKQIRQQQENSFATDVTKEFRYAALIPEKITKFANKYLKETFPLDKKELRWFLKLFPEFQIPDKI